MPKTKKNSKKINHIQENISFNINKNKPSTEKIVLPPFRRRFFSMLYEQVLVIGLIMLVALIFAVSTNQTHALKHHFALQVCLFISLGVYFIWPWLKSGQTLAMKTWRVRLLGLKHTKNVNQLIPLNLKQAILRYVLSWVWVLPALAISAWYALNNQQTAMACAVNLIIYWLLAYMHPSKQLLHDRLLGIVCVDAPYTS